MTATHRMLPQSVRGWLALALHLPVGATGLFGGRS
jgi:hypothetical protein